MSRNSARVPGLVNPRTIGHRRFLRFPLMLDARCLFNVEHAAAYCRLVDISSQGLGFEIEAPVRMSYGQSVLLKIEIDPKLSPVSVITELTWVRRRKNGSSFQRVGSRVVQIDPAAKKLLLEQAYAGVLSGLAPESPS